MSFRVQQPQVLFLIRAMLYSDLKSVEPRVGQYVNYGQVERLTRLNRSQSLQLLEDLWEQGVLLRKFSGMAYKCPHDGTTNLRPRVFCPGCNSENVEIVSLIEHLGCGHVDKEGNFLQGEEYICPKCGKTLRLVGVDYRKPGVSYYCPECDELHPEPKVEWVCNYGNHGFKIHEAVQKRMYTYTLNEDNVSDIIRSFEYTEPLADVFRRNGYQTSTYHSLTGASGVTHLVDIYAVNPLDPSFIIISSILIDENITPEEVLRLYASSLDVDSSKVLIMVVPALDAGSRTYVDRLGLQAIEGESIESLAETLDSVLKEVL